MGEQSKGEEWLPEGLPEGWKVEIRVRKSGKRDRYYKDPVNGYIFRSIKDIDRYLLTGKLGRHVTKTKPRESSSGTANVEHDELSDVSQKKEVIKSDGTKESCLGLEAITRKPGENASKRKASTVANDSKEDSMKKPRRPSTGMTPRSSKKKETIPFFILDSDHCDENDAIDIPNLSEIIDSVRREKEGHKTVYVSAPAIGSLLGGQKSDDWAMPKHDHDIKPHFTLNINHHISNMPNTTYMPPMNMMPKHEWDMRNVVRPYQNMSPLEKFNKISAESRPIGVPGCALFGNLLTDPCIDFAFKTLTGTVPPLGGGTVFEDCFSPQQLGSSRMMSQGGPCQT